MTRDFTLEKYKDLCKTILSSGYKIITVKDYIGKDNDLKAPKKIMILRHDVDRKIANTEKMAVLENKLGISSTYYFRKTNDVFKPEIIKKVHDLGHEVGFHYEVMDKAKGDFKKAIKIFEKELKEFRNICEVKTVCMHGNPWTSWKNADIWKKYNLKDYNIIGEPYITIDFDKIAYFTDTGRRWDGGKYSIDDYVQSSQETAVRTTDELSELISAGTYPAMFILSHPNRWSDNIGYWLSELIKQNIKNVGKRIIKRRRSR
jgi:hypothetical protein